MQQEKEKQTSKQSILALKSDPEDKKWEGMHAPVWNGQEVEDGYHQL